MKKTNLMVLSVGVLIVLTSCQNIVGGLQLSTNSESTTETNSESIIDIVSSELLSSEEISSDDGYKLPEFDDYFTFVTNVNNDISNGQQIPYTLFVELLGKADYDMEIDTGLYQSIWFFGDQDKIDWVIEYLDKVTLDNVPDGYVEYIGVVYDGNDLVMATGYEVLFFEDLLPDTPVQPSEPEQPSVSEPSESDPTDYPSHLYPDPSDPNLPFEDPNECIPSDVINSNLEIDMLVYIEGQEGTIKDIGNYSPYINEDGLPYDPETGDIRKYGPNDIYCMEMAKYFGAASAFKKLAPGVKINLIYTSISSYNDTIRQYQDQYGHLPHIMWATDHVVDMVGRGYAADVSQYSNSPYYDAYNEYFMTRFNFGGFQGGFPIAAEPWGMLVNTTDLEKYYILSDVYDDGYNTEEYKYWVDTFTWERFVDAVKMSSNETHAGLTKVVEYLMSYSLSSINEMFEREGMIDLTSDEVIATVRQLLEYENELARGDYTVYVYDDYSTGNMANTEKFPEAAPWNGTKNFCENQYATFYTEAPWALTTISQYINEHGLNDSISVDFLPYPMIDETSKQYTGVAVEGLTIGNQCPVDENGNPKCHTESSYLEQKVAAYFAMFMGTDPRSIEARTNVKYFFNGTEYTGDISLPLIKKGFRYAWQDNPEFNQDDPAKEYADNWQYNMSKWFEIYSVYVTNDQPADVADFTNIAYGLSKVLDSIYGDEITAINVYNDPSADYLYDWQVRFTNYENPDTLSGRLGTATYVDEIMARLPEIEAYINANSERAWYDLQDNVDIYYGYGIYDVLDRTDRNNYEGSKK